MVGIFSLARDGWWGGGDGGGDGDGDGDGSVRERENTGTLDPTTGEPIFSYTCHPSWGRTSCCGASPPHPGAGEIVSSIRGLPPHLHPKGEPITSTSSTSSTTTTTTTPKIRINTRLPSMAKIPPCPRQQTRQPPPQLRTQNGVKPDVRRQLGERGLYRRGNRP
ncbi:hypothetical protein L211DRAFT_641398 [Terfezia boudieri ATCC MYA-4762]|uniref:Uncharacterized protein n=1 Tax=Terfezia boudieri ATCC MYA-4762 TaxID=1051890 RepID=A0A3N4LF01_9PEZI|nr:hypothetical protein L211DRAFT_641398 [Terfezia boudieri ATCC MYA-4762]